MIIEELKNHFGEENVIIWGSFARALILDNTDFRDIDIMVNTFVPDLLNFLEERKIHYTCGFSNMMMALYKVKFEYAGYKFDIDCHRFNGVYGIGDILEMIETLPLEHGKAYIHGNTVTMNADALKSKLNKPNPDFNLKWFNKQRLIDTHKKKNRPKIDFSMLENDPDLQNVEKFGIADHEWGVVSFYELAYPCGVDSRNPYCLIMDYKPEFEEFDFSHLKYLVKK